MLFSARLRPEKALYPLRKLTALCQEQPPLLHFQEMLDGVRVEGGFGLPVARLGAAKALSHSVAKIRQHGKQPHTDEEQMQFSSSCIINEHELSNRN